MEFGYLPLAIGADEAVTEAAVAADEVPLPDAAGPAPQPLTIATHAAAAKAASRRAARFVDLAWCAWDDSTACWGITSVAGLGRCFARGLPHLGKSSSQPDCPPCGTQTSRQSNEGVRKSRMFVRSWRNEPFVHLEYGMGCSRSPTTDPANGPVT